MSNSIALYPDGDALGLSEPLAQAFRQWIAWSSAWQAFEGPWICPGRHSDQPLSEAAVTYYVADKARDAP